MTELDKIRNDYIRGTAHVGRFGCKLKGTRLRWFRHVQRRDEKSAGIGWLEWGRRGRPKRRYIDWVRKDMLEDAQEGKNGVEWSANPSPEKPKEEEDFGHFLNFVVSINLLFFRFVMITDRHVYDEPVKLISSYAFKIPILTQAHHLFDLRRICFLCWSFLQHFISCF